MASKPLEAFSESYKRSVSTRVAWQPVKIKRPPQGPGKTPPKASVRPFQASREWRRTITLQVAYRGTSEAWFEVHARGRTWRVDGHDAFLEVMLDIYNGSVRPPA